MRKEKTPVGTSECPIKKCAEQSQVYLYEGASDDAKKRRFAGRLYCVCPVHGRVENQEFLLENMKWQNDKKPAESTRQDASLPVTQVPVQASKPQASSVTAVKPENSPPPATDQRQKSSSWLPEYFK